MDTARPGISLTNCALGHYYLLVLVVYGDYIWWHLLSKDYKISPGGIFCNIWKV